MADNITDSTSESDASQQVLDALKSIVAEFPNLIQQLETMQDTQRSQQTLMEDLLTETKGSRRDQKNASSAQATTAQRTSTADTLHTFVRGQTNNIASLTSAASGRAIGTEANRLAASRQLMSIGELTSQFRRLAGSTGRLSSHMEALIRATPSLFNLGTIGGFFGRGAANLGVRAGTAMAGATAGTLGATAAGIVGGVVGGGVALTLLLAIKALTFAIQQGTLTLKENLNWNALSTAYTTGVIGEARIGNYMPDAERELRMPQYYAYRNAMRRMGIRDEGQISSNLLEMLSEGIAGGPGRADAISAARSRAAISQVFGIDINADTFARMNVLSQRNRGILSDEMGNLSANRFMQALATISKDTATIAGVQTPIQDLIKVFETLKESFRGGNNDFAKWVAGMSNFSRAVAEGEITMDNVTQLMSSLQNINNQNLFGILAMSGVQGNQLFEEAFRFRRQMYSVGDSPAAAQEVAQRALTIARRTIGFNDDPARLDAIMRDVLNSMGLEALTRTGDVVTLLEKLSRGDEGAYDKVRDLMRGEKDVLEAQSAKLDAIKNPLEHIRDLLFGYLIQEEGGINKVLQMVAKGSAGVMTSTAALAGKLTPEQSAQVDAAFKKIEMSDNVKNTFEGLSEMLEELNETFKDTNRLMSTSNNGNRRILPFSDTLPDN